MEKNLKGLLGKILGKQGTGIDLHDPARFAELEQEALERVLGSMHDVVGHAIIPYAVGGPVDMYYFPNVLPGTAFVTQELINPDGTGSKPSEIGAYELIAFTRHSIPMGERDRSQPGPFDAIELRLRAIFTTIGRYGESAVLNPLETCEMPSDEPGPGAGACVVFDEFKPAGKEFRIGNRKCGLLLCLEVFRREMEFARTEGSAALLSKLKGAKHYPYSDLDRSPVV